MAEGNTASARYCIERGMAREAQGDTAKALADYKEAIRKAPELSLPYRCAGTLCLQRSRLDEALDAFNQALARDDQDVASLVNRSLVWGARKKYAYVAADLERALKLDPGQRMAAGNLAWLCATCAEENYRNGKRALQLAEKALRLKRNGPNLDTLAAAYAEIERFEEAVKLQTAAIAAVQKDGPKHLLPQFQKRLTFYENRKAWRE